MNKQDYYKSEIFTILASFLFRGVQVGKEKCNSNPELHLFKVTNIK